MGLKPAENLGFLDGYGSERMAPSFKLGEPHCSRHHEKGRDGYFPPRPFRFGCRTDQAAPWQCLYLLPEPQGHGALRLMSIPA